MEEGKDRQSLFADRLQSWSAMTFLVLIVLFTVIGYPLALIPRGLNVTALGSYFPFGLSFPVFLIAALTAIPVLITHRWQLPKRLWFAVGAFLVMLVINIPRRWEFADETLRMLGYITIPLAAAVLAAYRKELNFQRICHVASGLWLMQIVMGFTAWRRGTPVVGIAGNINWMAALLLILSPWAVAEVEHRLPTKFGWEKRLRWAMATAIVLAPTVFLLIHCHSRAAWLALLCLPFGLGLAAFPTKLEKALFGLFIIVLIFGLFVLGYMTIPGRMLNTLRNDVRLPMWGATVAMIRKNPMGVGAGQFQRKYTPFRAKSHYHDRLFAADMTVHPHNEILNVAAQLGIPAMLAFLLMISLIFTGGFKDPLLNCARISAFIVFIQGCADMPLVQQPTDVLGFFFIGLCWQATRREAPARFRRGSWLIAKAGVAVAMLVGALWFAAWDFQFDRRMMRGRVLKVTAQRLTTRRQYEAAGKAYNKAYDTYCAAATPFDSLKANYEAGLIALNVKKDLTKAEAHFKHVTEIDPLFAHIRLLLGRLALKKRDFNTAGNEFVRECQLFPQSSEAWQNLYNFSLGLNQHALAASCELHLYGIYLEKAELTFPDDALETRRQAFVNAVKQPIDREKVKESPDASTIPALKLAEEFMNKINRNAIDPLFAELTVGQKWHPVITSQGFFILDFYYWRYRLKQYEMLQRLVPDGKTRVPIEELTKWFIGRQKIVPGDKLLLPPVTMGRRQANLLSTYLCFSSFVDANSDRCVIQTDEKGQPVHALVFAGKVTYQYGGKFPNVTARGDFSKLKCYRVDLVAGACEEFPLPTPKQRIKWEKGRSFIYIPPEEFFLRNQILGVIMHDHKPFLPIHPPSARVAEIFAISGAPNPPLPFVKDFCYRGALDLYNSEFKKLMAAEIRNSTKKKRK